MPHITSLAGSCRTNCKPRKTFGSKVISTIVFSYANNDKFHALDLSLFNQLLVLKMDQNKL